MCSIRNRRGNRLSQIFFENIRYVYCYNYELGCHSRNKSAKYPSKWKTFQIPPLTNFALAKIDRHTVRVYSAQLHMSIVGLVKTSLLPCTCLWLFYSNNFSESSHTVNTGFSHSVAQFPKTLSSVT